jgi:hypothetical protein
MDQSREDYDDHEAPRRVRPSTLVGLALAAVAIAGACAGLVAFAAAVALTPRAD